jgi:hypothetical protein
MISQNTVVIFLVVIAVLLLAWLLVYISRNVVLGTQTRVLLTSSPIDLGTNSSVSIKAINMPDSINGNSYTYMFWIKLDSFQPTNVHKVLWFRSSDSQSAVGAPVVMLDKDSNRMYVLLATNLTNKALTLQSIVTSRPDVLRQQYRFAVAVIDYVPMNRWAHVGIVANDRYVALTLDGELHSSGTVDTYAASSAEAGRPVIVPASGVITVGGTGGAVKSQMTRLEFCNYAVTPQTVRDTYNMGVTGSMMSSIGLPLYGLRNPFYRIV